ncbi:hypothetical protein CYY_000493 [Polysphondylium violaceum]|uniref:Uncharacterized protein n=1 Tax=Polysphondylium violaceum TaxID=133409 RepID=A0A8J4Q1F7_9MYCE|nr:hypothetical protein CYY_000493 [Polysphondylium violaceum]
MSIDSNKVRFFYAKNCSGSYKEYTEGQSIAFEPNDPDNDKYMSCLVGSNVFVNAYQHNDAWNPEPGAHENLNPGTHNDLSSLKGLSKFQILAVGFSYAIDIKILDKLGGAAGAYKLTLIPYQVNPATCVTGDIYKQCPIPKLTPPDAEIVCQVTVQETAWPGATVANGSIYFKYDPTTGLVTFRKTEGWPHNMSITQSGKTNFDFCLDSK